MDATSSRTAEADGLGDLASRINAAHEAVEASARTSLEHARAAGEMLAQAKERCIQERRPWLKWLAENVRFSHDTATRYAKIYREWGQLRNVRNSGLSEALKLLAEGEDDEPAAHPDPDGGSPSLPLTPPSDRQPRKRIVFDRATSIILRGHALRRREQLRLAKVKDSAARQLVARLLVSQVADGVETATDAILAAAARSEGIEARLGLPVEATAAAA